MFEVQNDAKMKRTRQRPLPSGRLSVSHAAIWASTVGITGTSLLAWQVLYYSVLPTSLCCFSIFLVFSILVEVHATFQIGN